MPVAAKTRNCLRQSVAPVDRQPPAGYENLNDPERLSQDPAFGPICSEKIRDRGASLPSRLPRFETGVLTQTANLRGMIG
jgi:hypothetical protein